MKKLLVVLLVLLSLVVMAQEVIKIGAIFPLTVAAAATGVKIKYAIEVA
jgi:branched-chain amino acid transport system substrate-binding protein